jgi:iron complex transport system substrate-binding protein
MSTTRCHRLAVAILLVVAMALVAGALSACGSSDPTDTSASLPASPITVSDDSGATVTLQAPAQKVVSIAPADTEIAYAIGGGAKMVGGTTYDDYPAEAKSLPKVGDFSNPSIEKIVALKPDLVLSAGGIQAGLRSKLEKLGMQVFVVDPTTYGGVMTDITKLGQLMGEEGGAATVVADMTKAKTDVQAKVASLDRPATFIEVYSKPLMTAGKGTFIDDLVSLAGGANIGAQAGSGFPNFSSEVLVKDDPAVYVAMAGSQSTPGAIAKRPGYFGLAAVKDGRVYVVDDNLIARPGPRLAQGLAQLAAMIHPEASPAP